FFCNQRKNGRLEVVCAEGTGYFYLASGSIVHAQIGVLSGMDAVHYAFGLPHASFTFSAGVESAEESINQSWQAIVLEGLRLIDEGVRPPIAFPHNPNGKAKSVESTLAHSAKPEPESSSVEPQLAFDELPAVKREVIELPVAASEKPVAE